MICWHIGAELSHRTFQLAAIPFDQRTFSLLFTGLYPNRALFLSPMACTRVLLRKKILRLCTLVYSQQPLFEHVYSILRSAPSYAPQSGYLWVQFCTVSP